MKMLRTFIAIALFATLAGCVYGPAYVRHDRGYHGGAYIEEGYGYSPGYYYGPSIGVGIRYDNWHRDKRHHRGWRDRRGHWHD
jgi:hypothetical protein